MPTVDIPGTGYQDLASLDVDGIPVGTLVRTTAGDYYRLAVSEAAGPEEVSEVGGMSGTAAIAAPAAATAANLAAWSTFRQPDVARTLTVTTSGTDWDGGPILFVGKDILGRPIRESVVPLDVAGTVSTVGQFASISQPFKRLVGAVATTVSIGVGTSLADAPAPEVVSVRDQDSMRWLLASDEVVVSAIPRLWTFDLESHALAQGKCASLQDLVDSIYGTIRAAITVMEEGGIPLSDELEEFNGAQR